LGAVISDFVRVERMPAFSCRLCGDCCRNRAIMLYDHDVERLRKAEIHDFYEETSELERYLTGAPYRMRLRDDGSCVFLTDDNRCSVYDLRPDTCRRYPFIVGEDFILVSLSCPGVIWESEGDPEPFREPSRRMARAIARLLR